MRVAILHDYLNQFGGAERVLKVLLDLFPEADLYTLLYDEKRTLGLFPRVTKTSFLDIPFVRRRHRFFIPLMPLAAKWLTVKTPYDLVVSSTAGYGKGINIRGNYHVSYCHSPLRYAWEIDYLKELPFSPWPLKELMVQPIANALKRWDRHAAERVNLFIANSEFIAKKIRAYYGREAQVIYPPVNTKVFYEERFARERTYYLMVGRLLYYKCFDVGIEAFNHLRLPLKIVGRGPEEKKLRAIARSPYIEFIPFVSDEELRALYSDAKALIFPQIEDFGLVAAEAQSCGLPVIAYNQGGGAEIVIPGKTGILFDRQTPEGIYEAVKDFERMRFDRKLISRKAMRFSETNFRKNMELVLKNAGTAFL